MKPSWREHGVERRFVVASASRPEAAAHAAAELAHPIDLVVASPTAAARDAAATVLGGRQVFIAEEPLLAPRAVSESGADVLERLARVLRGLLADETNVALVVCDELDLLGASVFVLDEASVVQVADALEAIVPLI
jgi:hypothetical protein